MAKLIGYIIFGISCLIWGLILVVPFLGFSGAKIAGITTGLVIAGENHLLSQYIPDRQGIPGQDQK